eukprot:jgi/Ulvmu1/330/UM001_0334.1
MASINIPHDADRDLAAVRARHFMLTDPEAAREQVSSGRHHAKPPLLPLLTLPWNFPRDAIGLSLYFVAQGSVILLMIILTILSAFPLAKNLSAENFRKTYMLLDRTPLSVNAEVGELWNDVVRTECPQTSRGSPNVWTNMTVGHFCSDSTFSSPFVCPATCVYNTSKLLEPRCDAFRGGRWMDPGEDVCNVRMPCYSWEFAQGEEWKADASYCFCCDLELDTAQTKALPRSTLWLWATGAVAVYMLWLLGLSAAVAAASKRIQTHVATGATFAVELSGPAVATATNAEIEFFARHYGPVVQVVRPSTVGVALSIAAQIRATQSSVEELDAIADGRRPPQPTSWLGRLPLADWLYVRMLCLHRSAAAAAAAGRERLVTLRKELTVAEAAPLGKAARSCIVVFNYERHASAAIRDLRWERGAFSAKYDGPRMVKMEPGIPSSGAETAGGLRRVVEVVDEVVKHREGGEVRAARAPEASDIVWDNMTSAPRVSAVRFLRVWVVCLVALAVSVAVLFILARLGEESRQERVYCTVESKDGEGNLPEGCEADGSMTIDVGMDVSRRTLLAAAQGLAVAAINSAVTLLLQAAHSLERHHSHTAALASTTAKLSVFYLLNSIAVPVAARYITDGSDWHWYIPGGIAQDVLFIQLFNIILPNVFALLHPPYPLFSAVLSWHARTQDAADGLMDPPPFLLPLRVANTVRTVALAVLYMPVLPASTLLGLIGTIVSYIVDQILVLRICRKPPTFSTHAFSFSIFIFQLLPFLWLLLMAVVYFSPAKFGPSEPDVTLPVLVGYVIWIVALLTPLQHWMGITAPPKTLASRDASYLSLIQHAVGDSQRSRSADLSSSTQRPRVAWQPEVYCPSIPAQCSPSFAKKVVEQYRLRVPPAPPIAQPMPGQRPENGGVHAQPPPAAPGRVPSDVRAMFVCAAPHSQHSANDGGMNLAAVDMTAAMLGGF